MKESAAIIFIIIISVLAFFAAKKQKDEWEAFKIQHDCKVVGKRDSQTSYGTDSSGKTITTYTPSQTAWLCNDGVTYWKN